MGLAQILQWNISLFLLVLSRWTGMVMLAPVFGAKGVPRLIKLGLAVSLSIILYPIILATHPDIPTALWPYFALVVKEVLVGLVIGFVIYALTAVVEGAGQLIDLQMGFTMGNMLDPVYGMQSPLMGNFQLVLATMLLLATNMHYYLIAAMVKSYAYIPINMAGFPQGMNYWVMLVGEVFALSVQLALPVLGALFLADIGIGLLSRVVPQMNIFAVAFPVKVLLGFIVLIMIVPFLGATVSHLFNIDMIWVLQFYRGWNP